MRVKTLSLALIAAGLLAQPALAQRSTTDALGTLGGTSSYASGINDSGQVAGYARTSGGAHHAFLYSGGTMQDLGALGGTYSYANGINASGQVAGSANTAGGAGHAPSRSRRPGYREHWPIQWRRGRELSTT